MFFVSVTKMILPKTLHGFIFVPSVYSCSVLYDINKEEVYHLDLCGLSSEEENCSEFHCD